MSEDRVYAEVEVRERLTGELGAWRWADGAVRREYVTTDWKSALMVANAIGFLAEAAFHHPELEIAWGRVTVTLSTHSAGGVTDKDLELAQRIERLVAWNPALNGGALEGPPDDPRWRILKPDA
ncbi:MAG TPA: 4a-hydroxytetrahydrobiopterin dehydratase [Chromatiales bacterium]|nr:4a-hydroxytetrahydrobiopterin dehydratase [Chromatiales bacterium]